MWRFLILKASSRRLPNDVYVELVDLLFAALPAVLIMTAAMAGMGALIAVRNNDPLLAGLAAVGVVAGLARAGVILAYRRRGTAQTSMARNLTRGEAKIWERRYATACLAFAAVLGTFNVRALATGDLLDHMLVTGLVFGYGAGLVTRLAMRPAICTACLMLAAMPTALALAVQVGGGGGLHNQLAYGGQALLVAAFALGSLETVMWTYRTTVGHLLTKRNFADMARQDALTGLPNRLLLRERFDDDILDIDAAGRLLAIHYLDLDRFKPVNDRYGHPVGDALLRAVGERLTRVLRARDTAARLGGDEFVIVQTDVAQPEEARMLAHRIVRTIAAPYMIEGHEIVIGVSVGIAVAPEDGVDLEQLASRADAALYQAKANGRGTIAFWREVEEAAPLAAAVA
ncbi:diguanylate cyclase (GGDEF)-like protein [Caulobacter ginsengisoli]|uniref:Diguanylate cyclase (GGDEF)-like protein n=1 Tax=Caulobacter ginsengisoli TaxID=400775 RepID=A0ABU0INV6_9CAUL|nr:GGDEF domain-containing protein [Caulobacter ginsengisoli]MDQ0463690.1 diguanylate cyclase (GGDEF)-like protein [Caulobacter ginsengisoli]